MCSCRHKAWWWCYNTRSPLLTLHHPSINQSINQSWTLHCFQYINLSYCTAQLHVLQSSIRLTILHLPIHLLSAASNYRTFYFYNSPPPLLPSRTAAPSSTSFHTNTYAIHEWDVYIYIYIYRWWSNSKLPRRTTTASIPRSTTALSHHHPPHHS